MTGIPTVAIIGGGFSGGAIAFHLAHFLPPGEARILVFDPRSALGAGLAYGTADPVHRINVPAVRMSLVPGDQSHFARWLQEDRVSNPDPAAELPDGRIFPRRSAFGRYVLHHLRPLLESGRIEHVRARVASVMRQGNRWAVQTDSGEDFRADCLVVATSHPPPSAPALLAQALARYPRFVADPLAPEALAGIGPQDRVLIVGTGLTMADVVASLDARGHRGPITAISRRGQRSRGHAAEMHAAFGDFSIDPARTALALLRRVRGAVKQAGEQGLSWHPVLDAVRQQGRAIWDALPEIERRRVVRHLRPYWDTHRFRIAPQVQGVVERLLAEGRLEVLPASVAAVTTVHASIEVELRRRGGEKLARWFDAVVVTTGPAHTRLLVDEAYLEGLASQGWISADSVGLGLSCDVLARALDRNGHASPSLYIGGPLARGTFGELMGLPEVSEFALFVARQVENSLRQGFQAREEPATIPAAGPPRRTIHA